jgi:membrane associated rhomboid family serine protease
MIDTDFPGGPRPAISARSKKQAMDWSLVLASQGIAAIINRTENGWELIVERNELQRAEAAIDQYITENRRWQWRRELPGVDLMFHWGAAWWVFGIVAFYYWSTVRFPAMKSAGMVENDAVRHGQWWRLFTAVTLHENPAHLIGNATTGFLLLGLVMARYGQGIGLLTAFMAGVAGNCAGALIYPANYGSLGASGMVTGALGMLTVQSFAHWRQSRFAAPFLSRAIAGGCLILVLIGFSPEADKVAHVAGFLAGAIFGAPLTLAPPAFLHRRAPNIISDLLLGAIVTMTWLAASRGH